MDSDTGGDFDGAKAALFCGDRLVCLLRDDRPDIPFPAMWDFPGGGREMGETPWQTLVREVAEEIGLTIHERHVRWHIVDDSASAPGRVSISTSCTCPPVRSAGSCSATKDRPMS